jgi:peptide/nickel transport system ATP-binding protein
MTPLLSIKDLCVQFKNDSELSTAVSNNSFDVAAGELVAIVGESGSGKSVTALSVLQLLPKQAIVTGEILFQQNEPVDLLKLSDKKITGIRGNEIAMIFQEPMTSLNPVFTCGYQVMEAIQLHQQVSKEIARQKTIELFKQVKLPDPEKIIARYPHELSGGQKQRVMIAMAMSCNPALLIADEPTTALDVTVQQTILELIRSLQQQNNMGVIFITHDLGVVADIADKILVMYKGEIVEQGIAKDILLSPKHPYTKALLACRPAGQTKGKRLPVVSDFMEETQASSFKPQGADHVANNELQTCLPDRQATNNKQQTSLLEIQNLSVHFPVKKNLFGKATQYFKAVDNVSFNVHQGDIVGLVGESGCGKTTLGRSILQLIKPTSGKILLDGKDMTLIDPALLRNMRKDLQIVFQDPYGSLNPRITIGNAILEPLKVHGVLSNNKQRKEKVMELLEKVSLDTDHFNRYPHQFSGGQRQRICIARALALNPSFLIFDESVSALDVSVQAQVLNLLNDLKKEFGFTAIFISHDLSVVHYICNRILVMHKGKIVEEGTADQVYHSPKNEYTQTLINAIPGKSIYMRT